MLACIIFTVTGCGNSKKRETDAQKKLNEKYNKNFVIKKVYSQKIGQAYYELDAYPEGEPDVLFTASFDTKDSKFSDNYVERHICKKISQQIYENLGFDSSDIYVFTDGIGPQPYTNDLNQSIQDYASLDPLNQFKATIFVTYENDKLYDSYFLFQNLGNLDISADIYVVSQEKLQEFKNYFLDYCRITSPEYLSLRGNLIAKTVE